ncbi:aspartic peptidase domain-containing protein [Cyathus striatus]|nr:aspartic peptidase domain-containing protein [Cyathus striatus]
MFPVQVDTGSSDLWIASSSCSTSSCAQTNGKLYNPAGATLTDETFNISYLQGSATGPIVWDTVEVGGYTIDNQALSAVNNVQNEPLTSDFTGILGLALPLNSIIANAIKPVTGNAPDGAAWASNLFSITPFSSAPPARFLSLALSRPGSDRVPSILGIGRHPSLVPDPSKIPYSTLVSDPAGSFFWKTGVRDISVWVNGEQRVIALGRSNNGAVFPSAIVDSGVPYILTTREVANAIYGAIGINPGSTGQYYVPCSTPLNVSITLDNRPPISLHPLDLTGEPPEDNRAINCIGLIQAEDQLETPTAGIGDMILGVPFMRNTYTVMAYSTPNPDGTFPANNDTSFIKPRLGLLGLTDPTVAMEEFHTVRVLNQPLPTTGNGGGTGTSTSGGSSTTAGEERKGLSVGIIVLIALLSFFALCLSLFGIRFFLLRRRLKKAPLGDEYKLARRDDGLPSEEELRRMRYDEYVKKERVLSLNGFGTGMTIVEPAFEKIGEFGARKEEDPWDPKMALDDTLIARGRAFGDVTDKEASGSGSDPESSPERGRGYHHRTLTETENVRDGHKKKLSITVPLLPGEDDIGVRHSDATLDSIDELGVRTSMAGVGTARIRGLSMMGRDSISTGGGSFSLPAGVPFDGFASASPVRAAFAGVDTPRSSTLVPEEASERRSVSIGDAPAPAHASGS